MYQQYQTFKNRTSQHTQRNKFLMNVLV